MEYPEARDIRVADTVAHADAGGGAEQVLVGLCATPEGFAALWRDGRHGNQGLVLGRVDTAGDPLGPEEPVHGPDTHLHGEPSLAAAPPFVGAVAWLTADPGKAGARARFFVGEVGMLGPARALEAAPGAASVAATMPLREPVVAFDTKGHARVLGRVGDRLVIAHYEPLFEPADAPRPLDPDGPPVRGRAHLAGAGDGQFAAAWTRDDGVALWVERAAQAELPAVRHVAPGEAVGLAAAPGGDGWWLLLRREARLFLVRLDAAGRHFGPQRGGMPLDAASVSFATWDQGLLLAVERRVEGSERHRGGPLELYFLDRDGVPLGPPLPVPGPDGRGAFGLCVAAQGSRALLAWTDRRGGDGNVYFRLIGPRDLDRPERRWNSDVASADQSHPAVGAARDGLALAIWEDRRGGEGRIFGRWLGPDGWAGGEFEAGDPRAPGSATVPSVAALAPSSGGGAAVVWKQQHERGARTLARIVDAGGQALGATIELAAPSSSVAWPAAVAGLGTGGFLVADIAAPAEGMPPHLLYRGVDAGGRSDGAPRVLARAQVGEPGRPHAAALDDGRVLVVWDERPAGALPRMFGRFLSSALEPEGEPVRFGPSPTATGDHDPCVAPDTGGGFVLAWSGNAGATRDIFARRFDRGARPAGPLIPVSVRAGTQESADVVQLADGSHVVSWQDDLSGGRHVQARRIRADGTLGAIATVNQRESIFVEDRTTPRIAALGDGLAAVWVDRRRGLGLDVFASVLGPAFDADLP